MQGRRGGIFGINVNVKFCQGLFSSSLLWDVIEIYKLVLSACKKKKSLSVPLNNWLVACWWQRAKEAMPGLTWCGLKTVAWDQLWFKRSYFGGGAEIGNAWECSVTLSQVVVLYFRAAQLHCDLHPDPLDYTFLSLSVPPSLLCRSSSCP